MRSSFPRCVKSCSIALNSASKCSAFEHHFAFKLSPPPNTVSISLPVSSGKELMRRTRAANCKQFERRLKMSTQEIIRELTKLNRDELAQVDLKLHDLLEEKIRTGGRSWGEALLEVAGTVEVLQ